MAYIYTEGGYTIVHLPLISLKNGDVVEETLELKIDPSGVVSGAYTRRPRVKTPTEGVGRG